MISEILFADKHFTSFPAMTYDQPYSFILASAAPKNEPQTLTGVWSNSEIHSMPSFTLTPP